MNEQMNDTIKGLCGSCRRETGWSIGHEIENSNSNFSIHARIVHTFVCEECGTSVKEQFWPTYQHFMRRELLDGQFTPYTDDKPKEE